MSVLNPISEVVCLHWVFLMHSLWLYFRSMQEVELDSKIKLIDCPGIVFTQNKNTDKSHVLRNAQRVSDVKDPFPVATSILHRASKLYFCRLYGISEYDSPEEFFAKKAQRTGKFKRGGIPDSEGAARSLLNDWNTGKIKYCTQPPEHTADSNVHISAAIVSDAAREFDMDNFEQMETEVLNQFVVKSEDALDYKSSGPVHMQASADDGKSTQIIEEDDEDMDEDVDEPKTKRTRKQTRKPKVDPQSLIEGNDSILRLFLFIIRFCFLTVFFLFQRR